jgi:C1A family cysteine protease
MEKMTSYCGIDCAECGAYLAMKNNDQALREKTAAEWSKVHNFAFTPEMINCTSCKQTNGVHVGYCSECEIRKCASVKGVVNCGACSEFKTCKTINDFLAKCPQLAENLIQK